MLWLKGLAGVAVLGVYRRKRQESFIETQNKPSYNKNRKDQIMNEIIITQNMITDWEYTKAKYEKRIKELNLLIELSKITKTVE